MEEGKELIRLKLPCSRCHCGDGDGIKAPLSLSSGRSQGRPSQDLPPRLRDVGAAALQGSVRPSPPHTLLIFSSLRNVLFLLKK